MRLELVNILLIIILSFEILVNAQETTSTTSSASSFQLPSYCPKKCGSILIHYPFGIGDGCFLATSFHLTCKNITIDRSEKLFLGDSMIEVKEINMDRGVVVIEPPIITMNVSEKYNSSSFVDFKDGPFSFNMMTYSDDSFDMKAENILNVTGCSANISLVDKITDISVGVCSTICSANASHQNGENSGDGYCQLDAFDWNVSNLTSLEIRLNRLNQTDLHLVNTSAIEAVMFDRYNITDEKLEEIMRGNKTGLTASLSWYIKDYSTCEEAKKNPETYACRSQNSNCFDAFLSYHSARLNDSIGYFCQCFPNYHGNPYLPDDCQDTTLDPNPERDCPKKCGSVDVPYPFGFTPGCYRDESFFLTCNESVHPPTLSMNSYYNVSNISLEEGQLQIIAPDFIFAETTSPFAFVLHQYVEWVISNQHCEDASKNKTTFACVHKHSSCQNITVNGQSQHYLGYRCNCSVGYQGINPYLPDGCKDIDECLLPDIKSKCKGICTNTDGSFNCTCPPGTSGDPTREECRPNKKSNTLLIGVIVGASNGTAVLLLSIALVFLKKKWKRRKQKKMREKHFRQNHGLLLQQLISSSENAAERTQIFSLEEIEKATNNFDETRVLGRGGHGTVYKGILSDQRVVAIKRSKKVKKSEIDQFINEVAILSQINHRHVVKLFGCCLEAEVPLLIYEFISNGALSEHLHVSNGRSTLSWDDRLKIAVEAAGALAYLHSAASISIFHRDVKSSNILLDDNFTVKISDFGASRFIPIDKTHLVTTIQGTFGYLDPEYYQTGQLTEKSDVYSFGVILLELVTGKRPVNSAEYDRGLNLAMHFIQARRENRIFDLVDECVTKEGKKQELTEIIRLIELCLRLKGTERPTMKEVEHKLQELRKTPTGEGFCIVKDSEEIEYLLTSSSSFASSRSDDLADHGASRNYTLEKEFVWSQHYPR